jgi:hypothetical protein
VELGILRSRRVRGLGGVSHRRSTVEYDMAGIDTRVARIAEATLAEQQFVTPIDILIGLG